MSNSDFPLNIGGFSEAFRNVEGSFKRGRTIRRIIESLPPTKKILYLRLPKKAIDAIVSANFPEAAAAVLLRRTWKDIMWEAMFDASDTPSALKNYRMLNKLRALGL